jgi:hypothetical protein
MLSKYATRKKIIILLIVLIIALAVFVISNYYDRVYVRLLNAGFFHKEVPLGELKADSSVMIALAFGQSNASNSGETLYTPHNRVLNYANGKLYLAKDPLMGASGFGGSVWGILGDKLIDSGLYKKVVLVPIGIGSTTISCWSDSNCNERLVNTLKALQKDKIILTHIFWHHGESDGMTTKKDYKRALEKILATIRKYHQNAPFYCSLVSFNESGTHPQILNAQKEFITENRNVLIGSKTDNIRKPGDRHGPVHFSAQGMSKYADSWYHAIKFGVE